MADDNDHGNAEGKGREARAASERALWGEQRARGFFSASDYVTKTVRKAGSSRGFAESRLLTRWDEIAGAEAAALCRPVRVSYAHREFGATLILWCEGARAPEVEMLTPRLIERVNAAYGYSAVSRIQITQSERPPEPRRRPGAPKRRPLTADEERQVEDLVSGVCDPGLKEALRRLGRNLKSRVIDRPGDIPSDIPSDSAATRPGASAGPLKRPHP